jgi:outer membrane receptor protein involved in Fe transport
MSPDALLHQAALLLTLFTGGPRYGETIVVVAERGPVAVREVPAAISVLRRAEVAAHPAQTLAEWVDLLPGFQMLFAADFGGAPMLSSRGFFGGGEAEYVQLRVDGEPSYDPEGGLADWRRLRSESIADVEVLHGAASALYGDTALGGVVDVRTEAGGGARAAASLGSFASAAADGAVDWGRGVGFHLGASGSTTDGFRRGSDEAGGALELTARGAAAAGRAWRATLGGSTRRRGDSGPLPLAELASRSRDSDPRFAADRDDSDRQWASLRWQATGWSAAIHGARRDGDIVRTLLLSPELADTARRHLATELAGVTLQAEPPAEGSRLSFGVDLADERLRTRYEVPEGVPGASLARAKARRDRLGAYASQGWDLGDRLRLVAGLRWDRVDDRSAVAERHQAWSPRLGFVWQVRPPEHGELSLFAQASSAFKTATLDQLFDPRPFPDFAGGTFGISNPGLSPQRARTAELGLRGASRAVRWQVAAYRTAVDDEIDFDPSTFTYRNIGASRHDGLELSVSPSLASRLRPSLTYAWTRAEPTFGENRGFQLKNIARHVLRLGLGADLGAGWGAELRGSWLAGRFVDDREAVPLPDVWILDARLRRQWSKGSVYLDVVNLTDRSYAALGYVLENFEGEAVPLALPAARIAGRAGFELHF